ncbi:MAG TPA: hypothetical protein VJU15_12405 [Gemmatimonadales bacterium]|nr:hypothetical protein [Gemmatimonadales bacterium]
MPDATAGDDFVDRVARNWRTAGLDAPNVALCEYAEALSTTPAEMGPEGVERLRAAGFDDRAILDATQVISYFNYINRIADGLGVDRETWIRAWGDADG